MWRPSPRWMPMSTESCLELEPSSYSGRHVRHAFRINSTLSWRDFDYDERSYANNLSPETRLTDVLDVASTSDGPLSRSSSSCMPYLA